MLPFSNLAIKFTQYLLLFALIGNNVNAQLFTPSFDCKKDKLHGGVIQFSSDPSNLILGQRCAISISNSKGKEVSGKDFKITSDNRKVSISGLFFTVDNSTKEEPWLYLDGRLIEVDGNITITHTKCAHTYSFPFQIRQSYVFDKGAISCKGEKREFAISKYKNLINKDLYVILDISRNQLYLVEAPIVIDASGVAGTPGRNGISGSSGKKGTDGTEKNQNGSDGSDGSNGGDGGDGGDGGNGGEIIVYISKNVPNVVSVNVNGGAAGPGGAAGRGGKGGKGGEGYKIKTGEQKVLGIKTPVYTKLGNDGKDGRDGVSGKPGKDGRPGQRGSVTISADDDIKKYFENVRHSYFKIEEIDE